MKNQQEQEFDSFIKNSLDAIPVEMPQNAWSNFASRLAGNQKKYWIWLLLSATTLLMTLLAYNYFLNTSHTTTPKHQRPEKQNSMEQKFNTDFTQQNDGNTSETFSEPKEITHEHDKNDQKFQIQKNSINNSDSLIIQPKIKMDKSPTDSLFIFW